MPGMQTLVGLREEGAECGLWRRGQGVAATPVAVWVAWRRGAVCRHTQVARGRRGASRMIYRVVGAQVRVAAQVRVCVAEEVEAWAHCARRRHRTEQIRESTAVCGGMLLRGQGGAAPPGGGSRARERCVGWRCWLVKAPPTGQSRAKSRATCLQRGNQEFLGCRQTCKTRGVT